GASSGFSPGSIAAGGSSTLTLSAGTAAPGNYTVTVTGASGGLSHSAAIAWTITSAASCPAGYALKFNGHSYRAAAPDRDAHPVASCHADGQHVVVINDSAENTWALGQLTSSNHFVWIGLHFTAATASWTWDDGTPLGSGFESFSGAPPTNPSSPCVDASQ